MPDQTSIQKTLTALAAPISKHVQVDDIRLSEASFRQSLQEGDLPAVIEYSFDAKGAMSEQPVRAINVHLRFKVRARYEEADPNEKAAIAVDAGFALTYSYNSGERPTDEQIEAFAKMNGVYNAWPYWREFLQSAFYRMGLPPLVLPVLTGNALEAVYAKAAKDAADCDRSPESPREESGAPS